MDARVRTASVMNLGCKVSFADAEAAARSLAASGVRLVADHSRADLVVINTCTVTAEADRKSHKAVRRARRQSPDAEIVVTGCSAHMAPETYRAVAPRVRVVDGRSGSIVEALPTLSGVDLVSAESVVDGLQRRDRTRAFVKVQDGCSFYCTYCVIPQARGPERSLAPEVVLADVRLALADGRREVVLTGINIGTYDGGASDRGPRGSHRWEALSLAGLIRRILDETSVERLRLSSIEPQHVTDNLLDVWAEAQDRCLPHFHLPLQSGDDGVLRRMGRRYDTAFYGELVTRIRAAVPDVAVHADVIVGFPTEDDAAWARSREFIAAQAFAGLHVFRYSERAGTPALRMAGRVPEALRQARASELLTHALERRLATARREIGRRRRVLFEQRLPDGRWVGHAENHVPVAASAPLAEGLENVIADVEVTDVEAGGQRAVGRVLERIGSPVRAQ